MKLQPIASPSTRNGTGDRVVVTGEDQRQRGQSEDEPRERHTDERAHDQTLSGCGHELQSVAPRIVGIEARDAGELVVPAHLHPGRDEALGERVEVGHPQARDAPWWRERSRRATPTCSHPNQTPPRAAREAGFGRSSNPSNAP